MIFDGVTGDGAPDAGGAGSAGAGSVLAGSAAGSVGALGAGFFAHAAHIKIATQRSLIARNHTWRASAVRRAARTV